MTALELLDKCRNAEADMQTLRRKIAQRRESMTAISVQLDSIGGGRGSLNDRMAAYAAEVDELTGALEERAAAMINETRAAYKLLDMLEEKQERVLHMWYMKNCSTSLIARKTKFSEGYVRKLRRDGENALSGVCEEIVSEMIAGIL